MESMVFSVKLDPVTAAKLARLAKLAGRKRGDVVRRLIVAAIAQPAPEVLFTEVVTGEAGGHVYARA